MANNYQYWRRKSFKRKPKTKSKVPIRYTELVIEAHRNSFWIRNYYKGAAALLEKRLSIWDHHSRSYGKEYYRIDEDRHIMYILKGFGIDFIMDGINAESRLSVSDFKDIKYNFDYIRTVDFDIYSHVQPRDDIQRESIEFLTTVDDDPKLLQIDVGFGKTISCIFMAKILQQPILIISKNLSKNWIAEIDKFTSCYGHDHIIQLNGTDKVKSVMKKKNKTGIFYIMTHATFRSCKKREPELIDEMITNLGIGALIIDEAHEETKTVIHEISLLNVKRLVLLTATPMKTGNENKLFQKMLTNVKRYGEHTSLINKFNIILAEYNSEPTQADITMVNGTRGIDNNKYIDYIYKGSDFEKNKIRVMMLYKYYKHFIVKTLEQDPEARILIYVARNTAAHTMGKILAKDYTLGKYPIGYYSELHDILKRPGGKEDELKNQIIFTTMVSAKTGLNVKNLRLIILNLFLRSTTAIWQIMGRLRKIYGKETYFIDMYDSGFKSIVNQIEHKTATIYINKAKDDAYTHVKYDKDIDKYVSTRISTLDHRGI